jgi:hypothetical protein
MSEEVTTAKRTRKAAPKGPSVETPKPKAQLYAKARYHHSPSNGDIQAVTPRLLEALALQAATGPQRYLADGVIAIRTTDNGDGTHQVMATLELVTA